jgi:hypothetical protein
MIRCLRRSLWSFPGNHLPTGNGGLSDCPTQQKMIQLVNAATPIEAAQPLPRIIWKVFGADAVIRLIQPGPCIAEDLMDQRELCSNFRIFQWLQVLGLITPDANRIGAQNFTLCLCGEKFFLHCANTANIHGNEQPIQQPPGLVNANHIPAKRYPGLTNLPYSIRASAASNRAASA